MPSTKPRIAVVIGSVRSNRFADKPAQWIADFARANGAFDVEILDLKDYPLPLFDEPASPAYGPSQNAVARRWQEKLQTLDGFIFTAAEYTHGPTAVLKNALDWAYPQWAKKPAAFVGYGGVGAARAIEQLRLHAVELQMVPTRNAVHIMFGEYLAVVNEGKSLSDFPHLVKAAEDTVSQFAWWVKATKSARELDLAEAAKAA